MKKCFDIADKIISEVYPGEYGFWGAKRIPNHGMLRGSIPAALESVDRHKPARKKASVQQRKIVKHGPNCYCDECYSKLSAGELNDLDA